MLSGKPSPLLLFASHGMQRAPHITLVGVQQDEIFDSTLMSVSHTTQHFENNSQKTQRNKILWGICEQLFFEEKFPEGNDQEELEMGPD